jgi:hypothetical protein
MTNTNCLEGIKCPACGNEELFRIAATSMFTVTDDGTDDYADVQWDDDSYAECAECLRHGAVKDFKVRNAREAENADAVATPTVKYTPGPWEITGHSHRDYEGQEIGTGDKTVAVILTAEASSLEAEDHANAVLIASAPAQAIILDLVQRGLMTLEPGEAEFDGVMYWFDARQVDWCVGVVNAIGWDKALASIAEPAPGDE